MSEFQRVGWNWQPSVVIGFSLWTLLYVRAIRRGRPTPLAQQIAFHIGTVVGLLALISPLDELGDEYLFSAHMVQHLLLMFATTPLWLIGTPGWLIEEIVPLKLDRLVKWLAGPTCAFVLFAGVMWFWHIPSLFEAAQGSEAIHVFEHITFIGATIIGWWPVVGPDTSRIPKPEPPLRMLYLFLLAIQCTSLAALLTFAHTPLYPFYMTARYPYGLNALQDQRLGGLLMWLPTHMFLLLILGITFLKWFSDSNRQTDQELAKSLP